MSTREVVIITFRNEYSVSCILAELNKGKLHFLPLLENLIPGPLLSSVLFSPLLPC